MRWNRTLPSSPAGGTWQSPWIEGDGSQAILATLRGAQAATLTLQASNDKSSIVDDGPNATVAGEATATITSGPYRWWRVVYENTNTADSNVVLAMVTGVPLPGNQSSFTVGGVSITNNPDVPATQLVVEMMPGQPHDYLPEDFAFRVTLPNGDSLVSVIPNTVDAQDVTLFVGDPGDVIGVDVGANVPGDASWSNVWGGGGFASLTATALTTYLHVGHATGAAFANFAESPVDPDPNANAGRLFTRDVAGKTQLCIQFPTGVPIVIATEL